MARVTVEDCIEIIPNRFELVVTAAQRAKQIASGAPLTVDRDNDKDAVVSLREIADKTIEPSAMIEEVTQSFCRRHGPEQFEAAPFGEEMNDANRLSSEVKEELEETQRMVAQEEPEGEEAPSFEDENINIED